MSFKTFYYRLLATIIMRPIIKYERDRPFLYIGDKDKIPAANCFTKYYRFGSKVDYGYGKGIEYGYEFKFRKE